MAFLFFKAYCSSEILYLFSGFWSCFLELPACFCKTHIQICVKNAEVTENNAENFRL